MTLGPGMKLGQIITEARKRKSMTQQELADKLGMSCSDLADLETRHYSISLLFLAKVAQAMGCCLEIRLVDVEDPEVKPLE